MLEEKVAHLDSQLKASEKERELSSLENDSLRHLITNLEEENDSLRHQITKLEEGIANRHSERECDYGYREDFHQAQIGYLEEGIEERDQRIAELVDALKRIRREVADVIGTE